MKTSKGVKTLGALVLLAALLFVCFLCGRLSPDKTTAEIPLESPSPALTITPPTPLSTPLPKIGLGEAIEKGDVEAEIHGAKQVAGASMVLRITKLVEGPLEVIVRAGTVLLSSQEGYQDMLVTDEARIALLDSSPQETTLVAYCIDASLHAPAADVPYSIGVLENLELRQLIESLPEIEEETFFSQAPLLGAIWSITDDITITDIRGRLMYGYAADDMVRAKLILEAAGIDTSSRLLFSPQNSSEAAT